jgi:hypothetical protein
MGKLSYDEPRDKTSELLDVLPFMSSFPFSDYEITMDERGDDFISLGVSPILVNAIGEYGTTNMLNFYYIENDSDVTISLQRSDIEWVAEDVARVKDIDSIRQKLDDALTTNDLSLKMEGVRLGKKFIKKVDPHIIGVISFNDVLNEFLQVNDAVLPSKIKLSAQKLTISQFKDQTFSEKQYQALKSFFNFQLHYAKIVLGIVISVKIY